MDLKNKISKIYCALFLHTKTDPVIQEELKTYLGVQIDDCTFATVKQIGKNKLIDFWINKAQNDTNIMELVDVLYGFHTSTSIIYTQPNIFLDTIYDEITTTFFNGEDEQLTEEEVNSRLDICKNCVFFDAEYIHCKKCGCVLKIKTKFRSESCPIDKW